MSDFYGEYTLASENVFARAENLKRYGVSMADLIITAMSINAPMWMLVEEAERRMDAEQ